MKRSIAKCPAVAILLSLLFLSWTVPASAKPEEGTMKDWELWIRKYARSLKEPASDQTRDLKFLRPLLKDKRIVQLGESTHGSKEMNQMKVRLIQYLHEELDYDVIAFESGFAETSAAYSRMGDLTPEQLMKNAIYGVWHTDEVLELFRYIQEQQEKGDPLILTGFDISRIGNAFTTSAYEWLEEIDPSEAERLKGAENEFSAITSSQTLEEMISRKEKLAEKYQELEKFVDSHRSELASAGLKRKQDVDILVRALSLRRQVVDAYVLQEWRAMHRQPFEQLEDHPLFLRDRLMAGQLEWVAEQLYPHEKIIVWGHNYHLRKNNTKADKDFTTITPTGPNMGDYLPERIKQQTYTIGMFALSGESLGSDNQTIFPVNVKHDPASLESLLKHKGDSYVFVDMLRAARNKGTSWMDTPRTSLYWGVMEEQMTLREQYDGILWIEKITASAII
ncbi:erythromycin esterase family protein [Paenibacillus methanolicus]|uniref:Erythromycin esterase n=1 Tax=Paenibacillus methanolicus TaxID=582686 RepID=A0A5S5CKB1_9BACL|nr:erythromycin esterase family protein [Paenibacillus methanolicus]TYP79001.1 erythromycin esterase [Paenibacillus methanolicus]